MPPTYLNGVMGVGATLTAFAVNNALTVDGYTFIASDVTNATRILVKDQANQQHNGIYTFSQLQTAGLPWIITRATDADNSPAGELKNGDFNFVQSGTANASTGWVEICIGTGPGDEIIIGTDNICYAQISGAGTYSAGAGLNLSGTIFSVATGGVTNAMLAGGITNTNLQNSSLTVTAGTGLTGGGAVSLGGTTTLNIGTVPVANGGTNIISYTAGDLLYATGATTLTKLAVGTSGQTLTVSAGLLPIWTTPAASGVTNVATGAGLTGGPITTTGTISIATGGVTNAMLVNSSVTVSPGTGLTGGGAVSLGSTTTLNIGTIPVANGGTNTTSYTAGDLLYATGATTLTKLVIGSSGQVLTVSAGLLPVWTTPAGGGSVTSITAGAGLSGGTITTSGTIDIAASGVTNAMLAGGIANGKLQSSSVTVSAGTGLTGGGAVSLGGSTSLSLANNCTGVNPIQFSGVQSYQSSGSFYYLSQHSINIFGSNCVFRTFNIMASGSLNASQNDQVIYTHNLDSFSTYHIQAYLAVGNVISGVSCGSAQAQASYGRAGNGGAQRTNIFNDGAQAWTGGNFSWSQLNTSGNAIQWRFNSSNAFILVYNLVLVVTQTYRA
jgi:hypothetical protein